MTAIAKEKGTIIGKFKERTNYDKFYKWLIECGKCPFKQLCSILSETIRNKLIELDEEGAAEWFTHAWGGDNGMWMNGFIAPGCVLHNNALESTWKWLKQHATSKGAGSRHPLNIFVIKMCRHFADQSKLAQLALKREGTDDLFPEMLPVTKTTWEAVQHMQVERMDCFYVLNSGDKRRFETFRQGVLAADGDSLYLKLRNVTKANDPTLRTALFPTMRAVKAINDPSERVAARARCDVTHIVMHYQELIQNPRSTSMDIIQILETLSYFHIVKKLETPWSREIQFLCSCDRFYKNGNCEHSIITSMMLDKTIEVPVAYCTKKPKAVPRSLLTLGAQVAGSSTEEISEDDVDVDNSPLLPSSCFDSLLFSFRSWYETHVQLVVNPYHRKAFGRNARLSVLLPLR